MRGLWIGILLLLAGAASAQDLGNSASGRRLAEAWCAECHQVAEGRVETSVLKPPSFYTIAGRPEVTPVWFNAFFLTPHPVMPNIVLSPSHRDDIAAYILGMKRR